MSGKTVDEQVNVVGRRAQRSEGRERPVEVGAVFGEGGGAAFVLIYLGFVFLIGAAVMLAELSLGRATQRNPAGSENRQTNESPVTRRCWLR